MFMTYKMEPPTIGYYPNFVIIGAMRCGTTSMARYLSAHPDVFIGKKKEVHFFDFEYELGNEWYRKQFDLADGETAIGEATPNYLYHPLAVERMAEVIPDARLIVLLRNPVDRAYSHYWHNRERSRETLDFEAAIEAEPERLRSDTYRPGWSAYLDKGRYLEQLERALRFYPRESLHVAIFEEFRADPLPVFARICDFLGVDTSFVPPNLGEKVNPYVKFRSLRLRNAARRMPWLVQAVVGRLNTIRSVGYPPMDPALRQDLLARFAPYNAELASFLGSDLSGWSD